jgi:hypothetical protein
VLTARATLQVDLPPGYRPEDAAPGVGGVDALVVGTGDVVAAVPLGVVRPGTTQTWTADLPAGSRRLVGLQVRLPTTYDLGTGEPSRTTLDLEGLAAGGAPVRFGAALRAATTGASISRLTSLTPRPRAGGGLRLVGLAAAHDGTTLTGLVSGADLSAAAHGADAVPAVLPAALATALDVAVGGDVALTADNGGRIATRVLGVLPALPEPLPDDVAGGSAGVGVARAFAAQNTSTRGAPVLVDGASLAVLDVLGARSPRAPRQWWVAGSAAPAALAAAAAAASLPGSDPPTVRTRTDIAARLADDPLAAGLARLLRLAAVGLAAVTFAAVVLGDAVVGRRRRGELAVLRALGLAPRELRRLLAAEQALVVGASLGTGALLGTGLAYLAAPVLAGPAAVAPVAVRLPWAALGAGLLVVGAAVGAVSAVRGRAAERLDVAAALREAVR